MKLRRWIGMTLLAALLILPGCGWLRTWTPQTEPEPRETHFYFSASGETPNNVWAQLGKYAEAADIQPAAPEACEHDGLHISTASITDTEIYIERVATVISDDFADYRLDDCEPSDDDGMVFRYTRWAGKFPTDETVTVYVDADGYITRYVTTNFQRYAHLFDDGMYMPDGFSIRWAKLEKAAEYHSGLSVGSCRLFEDTQGRFVLQCEPIGKYRIQFTVTLE